MVLLPGCCEKGCPKCWGEPEYIVVEIRGLAADCTPPGWRRDASTLNGRYVLRRRRFDTLYPWAWGALWSDCFYETYLAGVDAVNQGLFLVAQPWASWTGETSSTGAFQFTTITSVGLAGRWSANGAFGWEQPNESWYPSPGPPFYGQCRLPITLDVPVPPFNQWYIGEVFGPRPGLPQGGQLTHLVPSERPEDDCRDRTSVTVELYTGQSDVIPWNDQLAPCGTGVPWPGSGASLPAPDADGKYWHPACKDGEVGCVECTSETIPHPATGYPYKRPVCAVADMPVKVTVTQTSGPPIPPADLAPYSGTFALRWWDGPGIGSSIALYSGGSGYYEEFAVPGPIDLFTGVSKPEALIISATGFGAYQDPTPGLVRPCLDGEVQWQAIVRGGRLRFQAAAYSECVPRVCRGSAKWKAKAENVEWQFITYPGSPGQAKVTVEVECDGFV